MRELVEQEFSRYRSVLDLGCGPGLRDLRLLEEMGIPRLVGIDVGCTLDPLVKRDSIDYVSADIESSHLPIADESFDLVIMDNVIEHMYDPRRVLMECWRVLGKEGHLAMLTPNQARLINRFRLLLGRSVYYPLEYWLGVRQEHISKNGVKVFAGHIREYTIDELKRMLSLAGFEVESVRLYPSARPSLREERSKSRIVLATYNLAERLVPYSGYMISIFCRKHHAGSL